MWLMWDHSYTSVKQVKKGLGVGAIKKHYYSINVIIGDHLIEEMWWKKLYRLKQKALEFNEMTSFQSLQFYDFKPNASTQLECGNF